MPSMDSGVEGGLAARRHFSPAVGHAEPTAHWIVSIGLTCVVLGALVWAVPTAPMTGDGQYYIGFVRSDFQHAASSVHERRILGPLIVRALPVDPLDGFHVLTIGSLALTALLTWAAARQLVDQQRALLAIPLLLGTWVAAPNLREFGLVDPLAWVFVAAIWLAILRQRWFVAAVLGAIGVLAKEVVLLTAFAAAVAAWTAGRRVGAAIILGLPLLVLAALSVIFRGSGTDVVGYSTAWIRDGLGSLGPLRIVYLMFVSYAAVWLLVPFGFQQLPQPARRAAAVLLVGVVGLPLVGSPERMEEAIFPAVVAAAVLALHRWPYSLAWTLAIGNLVFVARIGGDARIPTALAWAGLLLAVSLAVMPPVLARAQTLRGTTVPSP